MALIIAIDGPAGSGKSTIAEAVAREFGFTYVNTGSIYRAVAIAARKAKIGMTDESALAVLAQTMALEFVTGHGRQKVLLEGEDISSGLREESIGKNASTLSAFPKVRNSLLNKQRELGQKSLKGAVLDGRDIGTVVFPNADLKIFLTADAHERARRRQKELLKNNIKIPFKNILAEIEKRDSADTDRKVAPLKPAKDAVIIDTTELSLEEVIALLRNTIRTQLKEL